MPSEAALTYLRTLSLVAVEACSVSSAFVHVVLTLSSDDVGSVREVAYRILGVLAAYGALRSPSAALSAPMKANCLPFLSDTVAGVDPLLAHGALRKVSRGLVDTKLAVSRARKLIMFVMCIVF